MDELINELLNKKIHETAVAMEKVYFTKTDRPSNPRKENPFKYTPGSIPVVVSAPHSVRHIRQKKIKQSDIFTGAMACLLNQLTGCHALSVTRLYGGDPNFDLPCLYKDYLKKLAQENKFSLLLDLHGASSENNFDIDMGTVHGSSLLGKNNLENLLADTFREAGIDKITTNQLPAARQNTVTKFASLELGIPSVQLEINRKYRAPNQSPNGWCRIIAALTTFIRQATHNLQGFQ